MDGIKTHKNSGFTMIEIITVLMIASIISLVVISRFSGTNSELIAQIGVIKSHLRYAQSKAMATSSFWYILFETTPAKYSLYKYNDPDPDEVEYIPGGDYLSDEDYIRLKPGISLSEGTYVFFDDLGRPYINNTDSPGTQLAAVDTIITSSAGNIEIKPETGFVP
ncbi:Tfp pilus assembly protein FimT/FimU [Thermodesulfobacteriota bacterium]